MDHLNESTCRNQTCQTVAIASRGESGESRSLLSQDSLAYPATCYFSLSCCDLARIHSYEPLVGLVRWPFPYRTVANLGVLLEGYEDLIPLVC